MRRLLNSASASVLALALAAVPAQADDGLSLLGVSNAIPSGVGYIAYGVHFDHNMSLFPTAGTTTATASWTAGATSFTVNACPAGVQAGTVIYDQTYGVGNGSEAAMGIASGACTGSGPYTVPLTTTLPTGATHASYGTNDTLVFSGPIAATDACSFIFSGWWRGSITSVNGFDSVFGRDLIAGPYDPAGASSEGIHGIDIAFDASGMRLNVADSAASVANGTAHTLVGAVLPAASVATAFHYGQWNHILWSVSTGQMADGSCPTAATNGQFTQLYVNGVLQSIGSQPTSSGAFNQAGVNFSSPGGGFSINFPANQDMSGGYGEWADLQLWIGTDILHCTGTNHVGGTCPVATSQTADVRNFITSGGKPVNPSVAAAAYGTPLVKCSGNTTAWTAGCQTTGPTPLAPIKTPMGDAGGWIVDVSSSPSYASASNPSGQPAHTIGEKWVCAGNVSTSIPSTYTAYACSNLYAPGDLIISVFSAEWSAAGPPSGVTAGVTTNQNCSVGTSGFTLWAETYNSAGGDPAATCIAYYIVPPGGGGTADFTGFSGTWSGGTPRGEAMATIDYGPYNGTIPTIDGTVGAFSWANASSSTPSALIGATNAANTDTLIAMYTEYAQGYVMTCPTGMSKRVDLGYTKGSFPEILICDKTLTGTATSGLTATRSGADYGGGALLAVSPK